MKAVEKSLIIIPEPEKKAAETFFTDFDVSDLRATPHKIQVMSSLICGVLPVEPRSVIPIIYRKPVAEEDKVWKPSYLR